MYAIADFSHDRLAVVRHTAAVQAALGIQCSDEKDGQIGMMQDVHVLSRNQRLLGEMENFHFEIDASKCEICCNFAF